jgi:hypothetical protein
LPGINAKLSVGRNPLFDAAGLVIAAAICTDGMTGILRESTLASGRPVR